MFDERAARAAILLALAVLPAGCTWVKGSAPSRASATVEVVEPAVVVEPASPVAAGDVNLRAILAFYRKSRGMSGVELGRERAALQGKAGSSLESLRLAILLGHEHSDLPRAIGLLDGIARAEDPQSVALQPLARLLSDQYAERLKLEAQVDRLGTSLRETERRAAVLQEKAAALQEKIDALAEIERNLPVRPATPLAPAVPAAGGAR